MATINVNGMHCENCKKAVEDTVKNIPGVKHAQVDLDKQELHWEEVDAEKPIALDIIMDAIKDLGYEPHVRP